MINKIFQINSKAGAISLILLLAIGAFGVMVPVANAATNITLQRLQSHQVIGVNQPIVLGVIPSVGSFASVYGVTWGQLPTSEEWVWPTAYATLTRPDGTNDTVQGPFKLGVAHKIRFEYTPNMVGTWRIQFVWPGDQYYNPVTTAFTFEVQQQPVPKRDVWCFINTRPDDVIGVNQWLLINAWVTPPPLVGSEIYTDYMFTLTKPDGTSVKVGPMPSEGEGTVWFEYPMDIVGQWTIKFDFPGGLFEKPATISKTINVQQNPVSFGYPDTPLPNEEWKFPINTQNRNWRDIAGPWYMTYYNSSRGSWNPYTEAPRTAHILWKTEATSGLGGFIGSPHSIQTGGGEAVYGGLDRGMYSSSPVNIRTVMAGRGYYTAGGRIYCLDMRTGETMWSVPGSFNVGATRSGLPALYQFGNRFIVYDGLTGAITLNVTGMPMQANLYDDPYVYSVQNYARNRYPQEDGTLPGTEKPQPAPRLIKWTTEPTTTNFTQRVIWNVSVPVATIEDGWVVLQNDLVVGVDWYSQAILTYKIWALNATTGQEVYSKSMYNTGDPNTWVYKQGPMIGSGYGKLYYAALPYENQGKGWTAYDVATGNLSWVSEETDDPWGMFWAYLPEASAYDMVYGLSYDGVYAFDINDGKIAWHYRAEDPYHETPYNQYVFGSTGPVIGGGLVFAPETEHSPTFVYRGQRMHALDAFSGKEVWSIEGVYTPTAIAYGVLVASDSYNGFTYGFGKGSTETTVLASPAVIGSGVLIEGTVLDKSTSQADTAAIADAYMTEWMQYLHMQQSRPTNATGVEVSIDAIGPGGNTIHVGTVTSNVDGKYGIAWTPPTEGTYQIVATFDGSESYYGSHASTYFGVGTGTSLGPAPTQPSTSQTPMPNGVTTSSPSPAVQPPTEGLPTTTYIAVAAAVIIAAVVIAAIALRRRNQST